MYSVSLVSIICCCLVTKLCPTLCMAHGLQHDRLHYLPEFAQTHVLWVSDAFQPSHPLSSPSPLCLNLSQNQGVFQWIESSHRVTNVLELQLQHQSFQWIFRLIPLRIDWFDFTIQGTLKRLHQCHSSKASILQHLAFFVVQLSHLYMTTGKTIA